MNAQVAQLAPAIIKKYANRRLYDTETSAYITLEDLCQRVKQSRDFIVKDAKTGEDLTRQILTQIILEQEGKGSPMLTTDFLRSVIRFYDNNMQGVLQKYLDASMHTFINNQERMQNVMGKAMGGFVPFGQLEEMTRQNVALFEKALSMFSPLNYFAGQEGETAEAKPAAAKRQRR